MKIGQEASQLGLASERYHTVYSTVKYSMGVFTWTRITFRKTFQNVIRPFPDLKA